MQGNNVTNSAMSGFNYRSVTGLNASGNVIDGLTGAGPVSATGTITFANNPGDAETITINSAVYTFETGAVDNDYEIGVGGNLAATLVNIFHVLNAETTPINGYPTDGRVSLATYTHDGSTVLTITYDYPGRNGNLFLLAASADTPSGASLSGGVVGASAVVFNKLSEQKSNAGIISNEMITLGVDTEILDERDFSTDLEWDVTGQFKDKTAGSGGNYVDLTFAGGAIAGTLQQENADLAQAPTALVYYAFTYQVVSVTTVPDDDFLMVLTGGAGYIPDRDVYLPWTIGFHTVVFISNSAAATGDFRITATETGASQGSFRLDLFKLRKIYGGLITEPANDVLGLRIDNIEMQGVDGSRYDFVGSGGNSRPNEAVNYIGIFDTYSFAYDMPNIAQDASYVFYIPFDGMAVGVSVQEGFTTGTTGIVYAYQGYNNFIRVTAWNFAGAGVDLGDHTYYVTPSKLFPVIDER